MLTLVLGLELVLWGWLVKEDWTHLKVSDGVLCALILLNLVAHDGCLGKLVPACCLGGIFFLVKVCAEYKLKRLALGWGDVKLAWVCGLYLNMDHIPVFLFLTGSVGCLVGFIFRTWYDQAHFPFVPAMACGFWGVRFL